MWHVDAHCTVLVVAVVLHFVAALRRQRAVGGAALESATKAAAAAADFGAGEATLAVLGEAVCGPGGFEAAASVPAPAEDVEMAE